MRQVIGNTRHAQRTAGAQLNANFEELYSRSTLVELTEVDDNVTFEVPAGYAIMAIAFENTTANAVTGGVRIGTTDGGAQVVTAQTVGANALDTVASASITKKIFSTEDDTTLYLQAVTAWNSASLNISVLMAKMF